MFLYVPYLTIEFSQSLAPHFVVRSAVIAYTYPYSVQVMRASTRSFMSVGSEKGVILDSLSTEPTEQETGI